MDVYAFHDDFNKLYQRTTPKRLMSDLLKNNHLDGSALSMVKSLEDIDEIWKRLFSAYGDSKIMLQKKMKQLKLVDPIWKLKEPERVIDGITKVINLMKELMKLSEKHKIQARLYHGDTINFIYKILGDNRVTRWFSSIYEETLDEEETWLKLIEFLQKDVKILEQKLLIGGNKLHEYRKNEDKQDVRKKSSHHADESHKRTAEKTTDGFNNKCALCDGTDHVATQGPGGTKCIQYFSCKTFVEMSPLQRCNLLRSKNLCFQCLLPGASANEYRHKKGYCQRDFVCPHASHQIYPRRKHVLVCEDHKNDASNEEVLARYKERCINNQQAVLEFSKNIKLSFFSTFSTSKVPSKHQDDEVVLHNGLYQLQTININGQPFNIFFDSGCSDFICRYEAIKRLGNNAYLEYDGEINMGGVGGIKAKSSHGIYTVSLPLSNGQNAVMTGACLDKITHPFPMYPLQGEIENEIKTSYQQHGGDIKNLPRLPKFVGGETDLMIGIKYLRYHPVAVYQMPSGLTIYKSPFTSIDGTTGIVGGPHEVFSKIDQCNMINKSTYLQQQLTIFQNGFQVNPDLSILGYKEEKIIKSADASLTYTSRKFKTFQEVESTGTEMNYRCIKCRGCKDCKNYDQQEVTSIKEEIEQDLINKSVHVDIKNRRTTATLPFIHDPVLKLSPNKNQALKVYYQQLKKLDSNIKDKEAIIQSEKKLHDLGYVGFVKDLPSDMQTILSNHSVQNYIPWRIVWKETSLSTPCRLVFDGSQITKSGYSLNDMLPKGRNNMNKLQEIVIRWFMHPVAFHTDVRKMYNSVQLLPEYWCYQRYIWRDDLDPEKIPQEKIIKTLIYGIRSSGNQAERAIRETAKQSSSQYPRVAEIVCKDVYVDDCMSGESSIELAKTRADEFEIVLNRGGFGLKGISFSGEDPPATMSDDGKTVIIAGMKWYPKTDQLSLNINEVLFTKKSRGRKILTPDSKMVPTQLTRRQCVSKVSEVFDLTGKMMPIISSFKLDLHELVRRKLDWDDVVPADLYNKWISNFKTIEDLGNIKFNRAVIPPDAVNLDINTLDFADASQLMACAAVYARFKRRNGSYSCQLVFSRSKLIGDSTTQPRAELIAALLNAYTGEVVRRSFGSYHKHQLKICDSEIVLHWLYNQEKPLKKWVKTRVLEVLRFTNIDDWYHVNSRNMIADIGTRQGASIQDVTPDSTWFNGYSWMKWDLSNMPLKSINDIRLSHQQSDEFKAEINEKQIYLQVSNTVQKVTERLEFSNYLINPNKFNFQKLVNIIALVIKFIKITRRKFDDSSNQNIEAAKKYLFTKATAEVIHFNKKSVYENISTKKNGVLHYTGRILPTEQVTSLGKMSSAMLDLSSSTFCVPVIDTYSPLAYCIINYIHWYHKTYKHSGIESTWRCVLQVAFIIDGKQIVKHIRKSCQRCRYLMKRSIEVAMGPITEHNLKIAPAFYACQVDLAGPFLAYTTHNKRKTVKVWMVVFVCCTTTTTAIKIMEDYSTSAFVQAFIRLSCDTGYPKFLLPDEGSQLIKGCKDMVFSFRDLKGKLYENYKVEFQSCPVGGHHMHGRVERKIREIRLSLEKSYHNSRLSVIQWETVCSEVSNAINNLPLALGNDKTDYEMVDLITPNRLKLGRNNDRSPEGDLLLTSDPTKFLQSNSEIFNSWFECWLISHVPKLMLAPKWFNTSYDLKCGDVVLFLKHESTISGKYQYGIVKSINISKDGLIRKAVVEYQNASENVKRNTNRSTRELIVIHPIDELDLINELGTIGMKYDQRFELCRN